MPCPRWSSTSPSRPAHDPGCLVFQPRSGLRPAGRRCERTLPSVCHGSVSRDARSKTALLKSRGTLSGNGPRPAGHHGCGTGFQPVKTTADKGIGRRTARPRDRCMSRTVGRAIVILALAGLGGCPRWLPDPGFVPISDHGFDAADNARDFNDYPWAMEYFTPDGVAEGHLYVATGNSVVNQVLWQVGVDVAADPLFRPGEIRRYRPDLGPKTWEKVYDQRDTDDGPAWRSSGFRAMATYTSAADGVTYLYCGTFGDNPTLLRSPSGDPGTWETVWSHDTRGSIRDLALHDSKLYVAVTHEMQWPMLVGEIFMTDGDTVTRVVDDGFGNPFNIGVFALRSFNGWLYAGTMNIVQGYEVWKLAGPDGQATPVPVITGGGPSRANIAVTEMRVFKDRLYVASLLFLGVNFAGDTFWRGADMVRVNADDQVDIVVGPGSLGGVGSGLGSLANAYLWSLAVHQDKLYCGTWDSSSIVPVGAEYWRDIRRTVNQALGVPVFQNDPAQLGINLLDFPSIYSTIVDNGGELWCSDDGVRWDPVFTNGLGNYNNYGVRKIVSAGDTLYVGLSNVIDGLEVWMRREE